MAISALKTKVKQNLKKDIENEGKKGNDPRFLNYFDLKEGEKMQVLFVPDVNGEFWTKFSKHGPQLKIKNAKGELVSVRVDHINCAHKSSGEDCPACQKGFDLFGEAKDADDDDLKEEGKKWMPRDYTLTSCVVLDSPCDIVDDEEGNQVKLVYLPYAVENIIKEAITEGQVEEDELCTTPFTIKKTLNKGKRASYENSYFARKQVSDEDLEFLDDMVVNQYDYSNLDVVPNPTTTEEVEEWLEKAEEAYEKALRRRNKSSDEEEEETSTRKKPSRSNRSSNKKDQEEENEQEAEEEEEDNGGDEPESDEQEEDDGDEPEQEAEEEDNNQKEDKSDVKSRLSKLRNKK